MRWRTVILTYGPDGWLCSCGENVRKISELVSHGSETMNPCGCKFDSHEFGFVDDPLKSINEDLAERRVD